MLGCRRGFSLALALIVPATISCADPATKCPGSVSKADVLGTDSSEDVGQIASDADASADTSGSDAIPDAASTKWTCPGLPPIERDFEIPPLSPDENFPAYLAAWYRDGSASIAVWDSWVGSSIRALGDADSIIWEATQADDGFCGRGPIRPIGDDLLLCRSHHCSRIRKDGTIVWETPSEFDNLGRIKALFAAGQRYEVTVAADDQIWAPYNRHHIGIPRDGLAGANVALVRLDSQTGKLDRTWPQLVFPQVTAVDITGFQWNQIALIEPRGSGTADVVGACYHHDAVRCGFVARALDDGTWTNVHTFDLPGAPTPTVGGAVAHGDGFIVLGDVKVKMYNPYANLLHSLHELDKNGKVFRVREVPGLADQHDPNYMMGPTIRIGRLDANRIYLSRMAVGTTVVESPRPQIIVFDKDLRPVWETSFKGDIYDSCPAGPIVSRVDTCGIDLLVQNRVVTIDHWGNPLSDATSQCWGRTADACGAPEPCRIAHCSPSTGCEQVPILQQVSCGLGAICIRGVCKKLN